jgi:hypothetical protein
MPAAQAQQQSPSGPSATTPSPPPPTNIPDKKLDAAAAAAKKVSVIKNKYDQQLAQAPVAEKQRLEGEAGDAMAKAVIDQGLSIEEYKTIMQVAQKEGSRRARQAPSADEIEPAGPVLAEYSIPSLRDTII